jgi:hypothetical protein
VIDTFRRRFGRIAIILVPVFPDDPSSGATSRHITPVRASFALIHPGRSTFGAFMKKMLPSGVELAVLATMAVLCAVVFASLQDERVMIFFTFPILLTGMIMGARRTGKLGATHASVAVVKVEAEQAA